ncbi:hypothetical protein C0030_003600 [Candidatus Liberibacter solanacearum]|uniref:Uncharacterized protein n=1 Tax=Candidatus Liberibacter solanacearum TaxID=556287 RepID=A0A3R7RJA6_9HYPH|nr:hypothetical protein [Candidatus Liberibacter solanacearum]RPD37196.1 hypothetical protein C0030_003600 [Candidatus Liberibacter solanacearum]
MKKPVRYSEELFDKIIDRITCGELVSHIIEKDGMPDRKSFHRWTKKPGNREKYEKALEDNLIWMEDSLRADPDLDNPTVYAKKMEIKR